MPDEGIHRAARVGFQAAADEYERGRPDYPQEAVQALAEHLRIVPGSVVLDLAAGTGKLTRQLVPLGARLVAVEPVEAMRQTLACNLPGVLALAGRAEAIPLATGSVHAAVVAQAFHWFDLDAAIGELHRVLQAEGRLGLVWNVRDESVPLMSEFSHVIEAHRGSTPRHETGGWRDAFERSELFTPLEKLTVPHEQRLSPDGVVDRALSISFIAALPEEERARVAGEVRALLERDPATRGKQRIAVPYRTDVYWCERR
ncbi:MAG: class I SAM-dependent methyltransferase [Actinomycetota bacterium]|nr:class I SAM-dependent methyltransferase [Actinomycetota bacterium]